MATVSYLVEFSIKEGHVEAFKEQAKGFVTSVEQNEPGTLGYQWWLAEDGSRCLIHESFDSSESMLTHLGNVGPELPDLMAIAPITRLEVFGEVSPDAREALAGLGAQHFPLLAGFER